MNTKGLRRAELKETGHKITLAVENVRRLPFGRMPEVEFAGTIYTGEQVTVWMPGKQAVAQLTRLKMEAETKDGQFMAAVGKYLTITRGENKTYPTKPFWNIWLASEGEFEAEPKVAAWEEPEGSATPAPKAEPKPEPKADPPRDPQAEGKMAARAPMAEGEKQTAADVKAVELARIAKIQHKLWMSCARFQIAAVEELQEQADVTIVVTAESINAQAATLFIEANRRNLI